MREVILYTCMMTLSAFGAGFGACWLFQVRPAQAREYALSELVGALCEDVSFYERAYWAARAKLDALKPNQDPKTGRFTKRSAPVQSPTLEDVIPPPAWQGYRSASEPSEAAA